MGEALQRAIDMGWVEPMHTLVLIDIHPNLAWGLNEDEWMIEGALDPYNHVRVELTPLLTNP